MSGIHRSFKEWWIEVGLGEGRIGQGDDRIGAEIREGFRYIRLQFKWKIPVRNGFSSLGFPPSVTVITKARRAGWMSNFLPTYTH